MRLVFLLLLATIVAGCDLLEDTSDRPWSGYALNKGSKRYEFWYTMFETQRDCMEAMTYGVSNPPHNQWYSEPVGCSYTSNSYWKVWITSKMYDGPFQCIARNISPTSAKAQTTYGMLLKDYPSRGESFYCM